MYSLSTFDFKRKLGISVGMGLLSLIFAPYGVFAILGEVTIDIPWSLVFPILAAMAFGWRYGIISGLSGGALFPFLLWANNGWANISTAISFLFIYTLTGLLYDTSSFKNIKKLPLRFLFVIIAGILLLCYYFIFQFNTVLAFNPPFWEQDAIQNLPIETLYSFAFKDSINIIILILVSESLLKLPIICRLFGIPTKKSMQANNKIFVASVLASLFIWLLFVGLSFTLLKDSQTLNDEHNSLALLVILSCGILVSRMFFYYSESQFVIQDELNSSEKKYRELFEANKDGIAIFHGYPDGKLSNFLEMNESTGAMLGYTKAELLGMNPSEIEIDCTEEIIGQRLNDIQARGFSSYLTNLKHKRGNIVPVEITVLSINYNNCPALMSITRDITERKKAEEELIAARQKAEESDKLKSAFLANMSHEIRTPMNGILGFAELLKMPGLSGEQQQEFIRIIKKSGDRMLNIINDIVDISKIESGQMTVLISDTHVNEQIEYVYEFFKPETEKKGIQLKFSNGLPSDLSVVKTDREKVYAILTNLVKNAIKYTDKGSIEFGYIPNVSVAKLNVKGKDNIPSDSDQSVYPGKLAATVTDPPELLFYVKDTGIGIPYDRQKAIFDRFVQADIADSRAFQGAGLGLSISKAYVEMMGGRIWVESEEGKGSAFYFTIPYYTDSVQNILIPQTMVNEENSQHKKLKILIVEDDETSEMLISIAVRMLSKEIIKVRSGAEAIDTCRNNPDIDLILMDIKMPVMDGYEATRQIRIFNKNVFIIAQTAYGMESEKEKALESGCNDYISKPLDIALLKEIILAHF